MKYFVSLLLVFLTVGAYAQQNRLNPRIGKEDAFKTYTTFTATSDDTTAFVTVPVVDPLLAKEVILIGIATDSIAADVYAIGRNSARTSVTETYADSIIGTSNTSNIVRIVLKDNATNRLEGCDQFKLGTVFRASGNGTTAGRTFKWFLWWVQN